MTQLITALTPYLVPIIVIIVGYFYHLLLVHLPAQQRAYVERWASVAVAMVEQQFPESSNAEKKDHAMIMLKSFFMTFKLPVPDDGILSAFIEAAVNALSKPQPPEPPAPLAIRAAQ